MLFSTSQTVFLFFFFSLTKTRDSVLLENKFFFFFGIAANGVYYLSLFFLSLFCGFLLFHGIIQKKTGGGFLFLFSGV